MPLTKLRILTDRMTGAERRFSLRTLVALSSLPLFGVVAAFGLAPDTNTLDITPETITEAIALPALASASTAGTFERESVIQSGDTLASALSRLKIDDLEIQRLLATDAVRQLASSIRAGKRIQATTTQDGQLLTIQFERSDAPALTVRRQGDGYVAEEGSELLETRVVMRSGRILSSLYGATDSAGIPDKIADQMAETFSTSLDFREDLRRGDTFSVIYTVNYRNGEPIAAGKLLAAEFVNAGKPYRAVLFRDPVRPRRLLHARRRIAEKRLPALAARIFPRHLQLQQFAQASRLRLPPRPYRRRLRRTHRHPGQGHRRCHCRLRRTQGRLWQSRHPAASQRL